MRPAATYMHVCSTTWFSNLAVPQYSQTPSWYLGLGEGLSFRTGSAGPYVINTIKAPLSCGLNGCNVRMAIFLNDQGTNRPATELWGRDQTLTTPAGASGASLQFWHIAPPLLLQSSTTYSIVGSGDASLDIADSPTINFPVLAAGWSVLGWIECAPGCQLCATSHLCWPEGCPQSGL